MGTALVLYDLGLSETTKKFAQQVTSDLKDQDLTVTLASIKSSAAKTTSGYDVIVIDGPVYAGLPPASVLDALANLKHDSDIVVGV